MLVIRLLALVRRLASHARRGVGGCRVGQSSLKFSGLFVVIEIFTLRLRHTTCLTFVFF